MAFPPDQNVLQNSHPHRVRPYLSVLKPQVVYQGTVTGTPDPGDTEITVVDVTGDITDIVEGMTILVGTVPGDDNVNGGRRRFRSRNGQDLTLDENWVIWKDGHYITVIESWELWPIFPYITPDGPPFIFYKDRDITYSDQNENVDPVAIILNNHVAKFLDGPTVSFWLHGDSSYPMANGASISTYLWECNHGTITDPNIANTIITFDTPNKNGYWVHLTVTDTNGKSHTTRRVRFVHTRTGEHAPHYAFTTSQMPTGDWSRGGWEATFDVRDDADIVNFPDKALCILWTEETYDGVEHYIGKSSHNQFVGYIRGDSVSVSSTGDSSVRFKATTIENLMRRHKMFSVSLEDKSNPTTWNHYSANGTGLTVAGAVHHLWHWHSTLLDITNVFLPTDNTTRIFAVDDFVNGNLYSMAENFAAQHGIFAHVCCDKFSQVHMEIDVNMLGADRAAVTWGYIIEDRDLKGDPELSFIRETERVAAYGTASGFNYDGTTNNPIASVAPGDIPHPDGPSEFVLERLVVDDQADCNRVVGRAMAIVNNPFKQFPLQFAGNYSFIDIVPQLFYLITIDAEDTKRGVEFSTMKLLPRTVVNTIDSNLGTLLTKVTFEVEATGQDGIPINYPLDLPPVPEPPGLPLGNVLISFDSVNGCHVRNTWNERNDGLSGADIQDQYGGRDPWWSVNQGSLDRNDAILWKCDVGAIFRSTDLGVTWTEMTPAAGPSGYSPASMTYVQYEGNSFHNHEHLFIARILDGSTWHSWILYTANDGAAWAWKSVGTTTDSDASFGAVNDIHGVDSKFGGWDRNGPIRAVAVLSDTRVILSSVFADAAADSQQHLCVGTVTGDTVTEGPWYTFEPLEWNTPQSAHVIAMDSETILIFYQRYTGGSGMDVVLRAATVSGNVINVGARISWGDEYGTVEPPGDDRLGWYEDWDVCKITDTLAMAAFCDHNYSYHALVSVSGNVCSFYSPTDHPLGPYNIGFFLNLCRMTDTKTVMVYQGNSTNNYNCFSRTITVSGNALSFGDPVNCSFNDTQIARHQTACRLTDTRFVMMWEEMNAIDGADLRVAQGVLDGDDIDMGVSKSMHHGSGYWERVFSFNLDRINDDWFIVQYVIRGSSPVDTDAFQIGYAVDDPVYKTIWFYEEPWIRDATTYGESICAHIQMLSSTKAIYYRQEEYDTSAYVCQSSAYILTITLAATQGKLYGLSIGKGTGTNAYITFCNNSDLRLQRINIASGVTIEDISLGSATIAEVDAGTWVAYPETVQGASDAVCLVHGRMDDPLGSGTVHVLITIDGGASGTVIESGWGTAICSAVMVDTTGIIYAFKDTPTGSELYAGLTSLVHISDLILRLNPGAAIVTIDFYIIIAGRAASGGKIVMYATVPFTTWIDVTDDHPVDGNVKALTLV
jgi:hypothetical protein